MKIYILQHFEIAKDNAGILVLEILKNIDIRRGGIETYRNSTNSRATFQLYYLLYSFFIFEIFFPKFTIKLLRANIRPIIE